LPIDFGNILAKRRKIMRIFTILMLILGLALICAPVAQAENVTFANLPGAVINVNALSAPGVIVEIFFIDLGTDDFQIGSVNGFHDPQPRGRLLDYRIPHRNGVETASVNAAAGGGLVTIVGTDGKDFTGTLQSGKIETNTAASIGNINDTLVLNLTNTSYSGTDPVLLVVSGNDAMDSPSPTTGGLTTLTGTGSTFDAPDPGPPSIASIPGTALLLGTGLLGLALLGFRRKTTAFQP
jgi:hypothetical protein